MKYKVNSKYSNFKDELLHVKEHFNNSSNSIHKARNELRISEINGKKVVIKAFKVPHIINQFAYAYIRDGKAKKSYENSIKLQSLDINTPDAISYIEFYSFGLLKDSYFLSIYEPYDFTIREVFHKKVENCGEILKLFAAFTYDLHVKGIWHVDYSPGNVLISKEGEAYKFSLVDINRMEFKEIKDYEGLKNFAKFWAKDEDLKILATEYASLASLDVDKAVEVALKAAKSLQDKTNLKRKLKAK
jgi:serine/threonine protein kinase